jgi:RNA polymerase sigma-70 factor (ECF subfamily)
MDPTLLDQLWQESGAELYEFNRKEFCDLLLQVGASHNFGLTGQSSPSPKEQAAFFLNLKLADLALARACAKGSEPAWERFLALYQQPLTRTAIAISGSETLGRDMADALYAELYGLNTRDGQRRCPLESYQGRGSLLGWLRTTLAQRHVDHHRRSFREQPLDDAVSDPAAPDPQPEPAQAQLAVLSKAVQKALELREPEDRFLLAAYYLDGQTLLQIGKLIRVHEATVSRKLHRLTGELRKQVLRNLQDSGMSKRAAQEALASDPRDLSDLNLNLKNLLQFSQLPTFSEKAGR